MAITHDLNTRETNKFVESADVAGKPVVAVANPDGTSIGSSSGWEGGVIQGSAEDDESNTLDAQATNSRISGFNGTNWDRIRAGITAVTATLTGFLNTLPWAVYNATPETRTDGQGGPLEADADGNLKTREQYAPGYEDNVNNVARVETPGELHYQAAAAANVIVKGSAGRLYGIILGTWVTGGILEVSDHATDGDGNVKLFFTGDSTASVNHEYPKYIPVNGNFPTGITADITAFANVTFVYR